MSRLLGDRPKAVLFGGRMLIMIPLQLGSTLEGDKDIKTDNDGKGRNEGIELGIDTEKVNSIISMLEFGITKEQILTKYTKEDLKRAEAAIANNN